MRFYTAADIVGSGAAAVALSTIFAQAKAKQIMLATTNGSTPARFGDSNIGAARGFPITSTASVLRTSVAAETENHDLTLCYVFVPNGTTLSVSIGV